MWVEKAQLENKKASSLKSMNYQKAGAHSLPFKDESFDFVTCQTVLVHLKNPVQGLREAHRVLKPGGLLLAAEPNNFANASSFDSLTNTQNIDNVLAHLKDQLIIQNGKKALGEGFNSLGWKEEDVKRYYLAGGGDEVGFKNFVNQTLQDNKETLEAIEQGTYSTAGGVMQYLISGYKTI